MSKQHASRRRSIIGASLVAVALAAFSFGPAAFGAGGTGGESGGGGRSGGTGGGFSGGGFSGGYSGGGFSGGHSGFSGGNGGGSFARPSVGIGGHSGSVSPSFTPGGGSHFSPGITGSSSGGPHPFPGSPHNPGWQNGWNNGNYYGNNWNWLGYGNGYVYPYYFAFVPFLYGSYGYGYPYYDYGNPYAYYALYNGDDGLPPVNLPQQFVDPGPPIAAGAPPANAAPPNAAGAAAVADADDSEDSAGAEFFSQAETAFQQGRYRDALKLANHAAVESPRNPKAHELMSLCMFALADYRGAAIEAHAAIALGPIADWATVFAYYGDQAKYTTQLRALEKYSHENPKSAEARFLRAYHYLMTGHTDAAKEQLAEAVSLTPKDKLAADLLKKYSGDAAAPQPVPPAAAPQATPGAPAKPANPDPDSFDT
jgi:tetratricopeptide (TPR) repeat protein